MGEAQPGGHPEVPDEEQGVRQKGQRAPGSRLHICSGMGLTWMVASEDVMQGDGRVRPLRAGYQHSGP